MVEETIWQLQNQEEVRLVTRPNYSPHYPFKLWIALVGLVSLAVLGLLQQRRTEEMKKGEKSRLQSRLQALEEALKGEAEDRRDNLAHLRETVMQIETRMTTEEKICREALRDLPRVGPVEREAEVYGYCSSCRHVMLV